MNIKTLILDFDGTIADTRQCIIETVRQTLLKIGVPQPSDFAIQEVIGLPLRDTFIKAVGITDETMICQAVTTYRELFDDICRQTVRLFPNVTETLQSLSNGGVTIAIASSRGKESLTDMLSWLGITPYITHVLGEQDVANKKPAPDMALHILSLTHTEAEEALVVGDTRYDILMGQNAGCRTCGVSYGNHTAEALQQQGADYIIDDFAQLLQILRIKP